MYNTRLAPISPNKRPNFLSKRELICYELIIAIFLFGTKNEIHSKNVGRIFFLWPRTSKYQLRLCVHRNASSRIQTPNSLWQSRMVKCVVRPDCRLTINRFGKYSKNPRHTTVKAHRSKSKPFKVFPNEYVTRSESLLVYGRCACVVFVERVGFETNQSKARPASNDIISKSIILR